jgi:hypothetical protein
MSSLKDELNTLLTKEMDRKTFMKHIFFAVAMLTGVSVFIKLLSSMNSGSLDIMKINSSDTTNHRGGYGRIGYGSRLENDRTA